MKVVLFVFVLGLLGCTESNKNSVAVSTDQKTKESEGTVINPEYLFNGKNLDGWHFSARDSSFTAAPESIFAIENGVIHVYPDQENGSEQTFAGLITDSIYRDYVLTLEYKWGKKKFKPRDEFVRDAGVLYHVFGSDVIWPSGVECQIQEGDTGDIWAIGTQVTSTVSPVIRNYDVNGDTLTRGTIQRRFDRFHRSYDWENPSGWNILKIVVRGNNAYYYLNGKAVNAALNIMFYDESIGSWNPLSKGRILLQAEGAEIFYRNLKLKANDKTGN
ncbi:3-keto-disaccharide hydrolase [Leeuwenhoekiella parthenopeia]|uniref:DUF1080 domain-containing protein n=1 Tax=Leeuwenhoekiella parthenopeia TaxID=2890320 RepID=A0ABS8GNM2_9FLAO|nr:DUF1080 domain-containing protein [Leeuwenhoekiella parthenopeia]MCC4211263.1 DUF1080 domain-containing protein [Leeuwenhoekiella parthenopeia]